MKLIRNPWVFTGAVVLGTALAGCSSKSNDGGASNVSNSGGANGANTGGAGSNTGGTTAASTAAGGFNQQTYCNGIFKEVSCSQTQVEADVRTVNMLLVLDESGSMKESPAANAPSKWLIMKDALQSALVKVADNINFGLLLYPYLDGGIPAGSVNPAETCAVPDNPGDAVNVPIGVGQTALAEVLAKIDSQTPAGGTPTARALKQAYNYFVNGEGQKLSGSKWVLLATDGGPNCNLGLTCGADGCTQNIDGNCQAGFNCCDGAGFACLDDEAATTQIGMLATQGVKTFVIGVPGTDAYANSLNNFANAGKMPNTSGASGELYYAISATTARDDLVDAFGEITTQLIKSCDIELKASPPNPEKVSVAIDCALQPVVPTGSAPDAGVDGYYVDYSYAPKPAHIKLVGAPCDAITAQGAHHVDVIVGCQGVN